MSALPIKKFSLIRPTNQTPFHVDFDWWKQHDTNWRVYLHSCLCAEHQAAFTNLEEGYLIDWVDAETAEVTSVDGLEHILMTHCSLLPDFLDMNMPLVDAVFRVFVAHHNTPMSSLELSEFTGKSSDIILRTLAGPQIYKGIRPIH
jgi:hypothetical protein